jgi:hypothetical protein
VSSGQHLRGGGQLVPGGFGAGVRRIAIIGQSAYLRVHGATTSISAFADAMGVRTAACWLA